jgi:hypothetical protein
MTCVGVGHVARHEHAAELLGEGLTLVLLAVEVGDHDLGAERGEVAGWWPRRGPMLRR